MKRIGTILPLVAMLLLTSPAAGLRAGSDGAMPVYHVPLRVHIAASSRPKEEFPRIFSEINAIWFSQARICFDIEAVRSDAEAERGLEMWFRPSIGALNGSYDGEIILMKDHPTLAPAPHPAQEGAARTAAHELGHALGLHHAQNSADNLMRSKTYGWHLNRQEITQARNRAAKLAVSAGPETSCSLPIFRP